MTSLLRAIGMLALCAGVLLGCRPPEEPTRAAADTVRLAVLSPALGVILRDIGGAELAVARHGFDIALDTTLPVAGDQTGVDYETLLRVRPTHVLLEWGSRELPPRLLTLSSERGWIVQSLPMLTLAEIRLATNRLGEITGHVKEASAVTARMDSALARDDALAARAGRVLTLYSVRPAGAAGPGSFHVQILESLGARPIPDSGSPYVSLDHEDLRRLNPDTIVVLAPGASPDRLDEFRAPLRALGLRAATDHRVIIDTHPENQTPSTAMISLAERLRAALERLAPLSEFGAHP